MNLEEAIKLLKQEPDFSLSYYKREYAIDLLLKAYEKQQKEIEKYRKLRADIIKVNKKIYDVDIIEDMCEQLANCISKDKVLAIFKKYGLDEKECFFSSTSDIIKFVEDMRKLMEIGE